MGNQAIDVTPVYFPPEIVGVIASFSNLSTRRSMRVVCVLWKTEITTHHALHDIPLHRTSLYAVSKPLMAMKRGDLPILQFYCESSHRPLETYVQLMTASCTYGYLNILKWAYAQMPIEARHGAKFNQTFFRAAVQQGRLPIVK